MDILGNPQVTELLTQLLLLVITTVTAALAAKASSFIKTHTSTSQQELLMRIAREAVKAAEQAGLNNAITNKKESAFNIVDAALASAGLGRVITAEQIDAAIESAVFEQFNSWKPLDNAAADEAV